MLTDVKVAKLKYEGSRESGKLSIEKHPDRDGLYLAVSPAHKDNPKATYGSKVWRYEYRWPATTHGKRQTLTYGKYPEVSLAEAREKHLDARKSIANGVNPAEEKQNQKRTMLAALGNVYEAIAAKWFEAEKAGKSKSWSENNDRWLKVVNKTLGNKPIGNITHDDCYNAVRPLEEQGYAFSAERARQQIAQVFAYAIRKRLHAGGNPARDLKGEIKVPEHKNNVHIKAREIPEFLKAVDGSKGAEQTKIASRLLLLTIVRKQELLAAKRTELDLEAGLWEIPAERMKNGSPHLVPLSRQTVALFKRQLEIAGKGDYVFPNAQRPGRHAGLSTLNVFFDRIGFNDRLTPHGLRSVASTELNGSGFFRPDVIERQLSHIERNKIRNAYNKADYLDERTRMMQYWSDFVDRLCDGKPEEKNVIQLQPKAA
jgi:integrase